MRGERVVNTRSLDQAAELDALLTERGAVPLSYPCIDIAPPLDGGALARALAQLAEGRFDWIVFTSANAVRAVAAAAGPIDESASTPALDVGGALVAAVGPGTAQAVRQLLRVAVDLEPQRYAAEDLARELVARKPGEVLLPLADRAREVLPRALREGGARVTEVTAYRTVLGRGGVDLASLLRRGEVEAVLFTSPSTVDNLAVRLQEEGGGWSSLQEVCVGCIGPVTSRAAAEKGLRVQVQPEEHTLMGLVDALETYFAASGAAGATGRPAAPTLAEGRRS